MASRGKRTKTGRTKRQNNRQNVPKPVVARTELRAVVAGDVAGNGLTTQSAPQPIS